MNRLRWKLDVFLTALGSPLSQRLDIFTQLLDGRWIWDG